MPTLLHLQMAAKSNANMDLLSVGSEDWAQQFKDAITWPHRVMVACLLASLALRVSLLSWANSLLWGWR